MGYDWLPNEVYLKALKSISVDGAGHFASVVSLADLWETQYIIEQSRDMAVGSPGFSLSRISEVDISNALVNNTVEVPFKSVAVTSIIVDGLLACAFIYEYSSHVHFQDWPLEIARERIGTRGKVVELGKQGLEYLEGHTAVQAVVYPETFGLGLRPAGLEQVRAGGLHARSLKCSLKKVPFEGDKANARNSSGVPGNS